MKDKRDIIRPCDFCRELRLLSQWQNTYYTICKECAKDWAREKDVKVEQ